MGFFSKLKANMNHGGVEVRLQAPSSAASNEVIPVQVTMTADSAQTVANVKVELKAQAKELGMTMGRGTGVGVQQSTSTKQTVAVAESRQPLNLNPGEPQTVTVQLYLNGGSSSLSNVLGGTGEALGGMLQTALTAAQSFNHINFIYTVHASADVEGIAMDPSDEQPIQILPAASNAAPVAPNDKVSASTASPVSAETQQNIS